MPLSAGPSATVCVVPFTPAFCPLPGGGSALGAGVTVACTPSCGCVPGCADDLEFLIRGQAIHLTISAYRFAAMRRRSVIRMPPIWVVKNGSPSQRHCKAVRPIRLVALFPGSRLGTRCEHLQVKGKSQNLVARVAEDRGGFPPALLRKAAANPRRPAPRYNRG